MSNRTSNKRAVFAQHHDHQEEFSRSVFKKLPTQRQKWGDDQVLPHVNWGDLFFDLFYVAGAYNLAYIIKSDPSAMSVLYFFGCFGPLINCFWFNKMMYDAKFQIPDDIIHMIGNLFQLCALASAVLHIRPVSYMSHGETHPEMFIFCSAVWLGIAYGYLLNMEIRFLGVNGQNCARYATMTEMILETPSFILYTAAVIYSAIVFYTGGSNSADDSYDHRLLGGDADVDVSISSDPVHHVPIILLLLAWFLRLALHVPIDHIRGEGKSFKDLTVPLNVEYAIHRYGELTMLMMGESILSLLISDINSETFEYYFTFYCGIASVALMQYLYYKSQPHHGDAHSIRRSRVSGLVFVILIQIFCTALIIIGVSYKMLVAEYEDTPTIGSYTDSLNVDKDDLNHLFGRMLAGGSSSKYTTEERRQRISYFFCFGLGIAYICLDFMALSHNGIAAIVERVTTVRDEYETKHNYQSKGILVVVVLRVAIVLFLFTAPIYVTKPYIVALIGLITVVLQLVTRYFGHVYFPSKAQISRLIIKKSSRRIMNDPESNKNIGEEHNLSSEDDNDDVGDYNGLWMDQASNSSAGESENKNYSYNLHDGALLPNERNLGNGPIGLPNFLTSPHNSNINDDVRPSAIDVVNAANFNNGGYSNIDNHNVDMHVGIEVVDTALDKEEHAPDQDKGQGKIDGGTVLDEDVEAVVSTDKIDTFEVNVQIKDIGTGTASGISTVTANDNHKNNDENNHKVQMHSHKLDSNLLNGNGAREVLKTTHSASKLVRFTDEGSNSNSNNGDKEVKSNENFNEVKGNKDNEGTNIMLVTTEISGDANSSDCSYDDDNDGNNDDGITYDDMTAL